MKDDIDIDALQDKLNKRIKMRRRNKKNWTGGNDYTIKKDKNFNIKKGKYIRGEE